MTRLLTLVVLGIALVSTLAEARSKRIHVTAKVVEATFTGAPDHPKIGDQRITIVDLYDKNETKVGTGVGVCTLVTTQTQTRFNNASSRRLLTRRGISFLEVSPRCPRSGRCHSSAFWAAQRNFAKPAGKRYSS